MKELAKESKNKPLLGFCETFEERAHEMPPDKQGRWVGYLQGVLISEGLLNTEEERNRTRPKFHELYRKFNLSTETIQ